MKSKVGVWIDHRRAFISFVDEPMQVIRSGLQSRVRFSGTGTHEEGIAENQRNRHFSAHLVNYFDRVIEHIASAKSIYIFGPGEAKIKLKSRLQQKNLDSCIVDIDTVDKMTPHQITEKTHKYFVQH